jgi:ubiquinone/menaquinone biosynthesis C-methylase UbiE
MQMDLRVRAVSARTMGTEPPPLAHYQAPFVERIARVLRANFLPRTPSVRILDAGCDSSGRQLWHIAQLTRGEVVGINIGEGFPSAEALALLPGNASLVNMDATDLKFADGTFDMVVSANVLEHVNDPVRYLSECSRVLRAGGIGCFETYPVWTGPRGHHAMEVMVQRFCSDPDAYKNDGSIIPDWSHLVYDEEKMRAAIGDKVPAEVRDYLLYVIFRAPDMNRVSWSTIAGAFRDNFGEVMISPSFEDGAVPTLRPDSPVDDYDVAGFSAVTRKSRSSGTSLFWRQHILWRMKNLLGW